MFYLLYLINFELDNFSNLGGIVLQFLKNTPKELRMFLCKLAPGSVKTVWGRSWTKMDRRVGATVRFRLRGLSVLDLACETVIKESLIEVNEVANLAKTRSEN